MTTIPLHDLNALLGGFADKRFTPTEVVEAAYVALEQANDPALVITLVDRAANIKRAQALTNEAGPLAGIPFVVKDNIDLAGVPTTAGCPGYSYIPQESATVVQRLLDAGAICIAKVNLDQFATGLVGVRSPYGIPQNPLNPSLIPGGSSSGSAVAVSRGIVPFSLGTDTAGSGRVPGATCRIVGAKPSRGRLSAKGVVPAVRSLDCVSIFAQSCADARLVLHVAEGFDKGDAFSRKNPQPPQRPLRRLAIPRADQRVFGDCSQSQEAFEQAVQRLVDQGVEFVEIDWQFFAETALLLYEGPWVAERTAAVGEAIAADSEGLDPTVAQIVAGGHAHSAVAAHLASYRLEELRAKIRPLWDEVDGLIVPTIPRVPTLAEVAAEPVAANSALGTYTNFTNLLDLSGLALPIDLADGAPPMGLTLLAPAWQDEALLSWGEWIHPLIARRCGATTYPVKPASAQDDLSGWTEVTVFGAHLRGQPLNHRLIELGGHFARAIQTAAHYRMVLLEDGPIAKPGVIPVDDSDGVSFYGETWRLPPWAIADLLAEIPAPLGLGHVTLDDNSQALGFICSLPSHTPARDISAYADWRKFISSKG